MHEGSPQENAERGTGNAEREVAEREVAEQEVEERFDTTHFPPLPCFPCPHASNCCSWGVTLSDEEAQALGERYGHHLMYKSRWGEWRTRVKQGKCVFLVDNACSIHADPHYPAVCRGFPFVDAETGGPYRYDQTICPEFVQRDDLKEIRRRVAAGPVSTDRPRST
ncbi:MAG TPA: YkgJ family cysteine cluster protein [Gemmatimonadales bacterium]|nr:YkgJ family cysteine cluster protein [Gemmatimonadales bacterium]